MGIKMETQRPGKIALVDNAWLSAAVQGMGIGRISAAGLYGILKHKVGHERNFYQRPVITLHPCLDVPGNPITEKFKKTGFHVIHADSTNEEDDMALVDALKSADPNSISEIAIVGGDHRYVRPALRKVQEIEAIHGRRTENRVWWLTTEFYGSRGTSCIGKELRSYFERARFGLVELADFKRQLEFRPDG
ncbi:NYN domain-containing protein [Patescibacteria group bacterium]|nr:NYN domain-containing protein [Patescibacteria group bacterium]